MLIVKGRICKLLSDLSGELAGFVLDSGVDVYFPSDQAYLMQGIAVIGAQVEVSGRTCSGTTNGANIHAYSITSLDSMKATALHTLPTPQSPEVPANLSARPSLAPLAPTLTNYPWSQLSQRPESQSLTTDNDVVDEIEEAYAHLHRTQAMLAYLKMIRQEKSAVGKYLDEAKHTYMQALSRYQTRDLERAGELAAASNSLSRLVEILISRALRSSTDYPRLVPPPPEHVYACGETEMARHALDRVERLLVWVHGVTQNGTLPREDGAQIARLSSWSDWLCRWAHRLLDTGSVRDATEFAQAAEAAVCSAEHLCGKSYMKSSIEAAAPM